MYISLNQRLTQAGAVALNDPPADLNVVPIPLDDASLVADSAGESVTFAGTGAPAADTELYLFGQAPSSPGRTTISNSWRFLGVQAATATTPWLNDISDLYNALFPGFTTGQAIGILVASLNTLNGALATGIQMQAIAT